jgi:hypothetical protein
MKKIDLIIKKKYLEGFFFFNYWSQIQQSVFYFIFFIQQFFEFHQDFSLVLPHHQSLFQTDFNQIDHHRHHFKSHQDFYFFWG